MIFVNEYIKTVEGWLKKHAMDMLRMVLFGCAVYFALISQNLVNSMDGLWNNSIYFADSWERSIGRWFWPYLDMLRFGVVSYQLNSIITLILDAMAVSLLADLLAVKNKKIIFLMGALFIASPLTCVSLSYSYMSPTFGMAFFLSVCAAYCILKTAHPVAAILAGSVLIACDMGCYQAYLGTTCVIILFYMMKQILKNADLKEIGLLVLRSSGAVLCGGGMYKLAVVVVNRIYDVSLSSYKGANEVSVSNIILSLPDTIPAAYKAFYRFFCTAFIQNNIFGNKKVNICIIFVVCCLVLYMLFQFAKRNWIGAGLLFLLVLLIPLAANISLLIAVKMGTEENMILLMTGGMVLCPALFLAVFYSFRKHIPYYGIYTVALWVNIFIVNNDQVAMREGRTGAVTVTQNILSRMADEGYLGGDTKYEIAFIGKPSESRLFQKSDAWRQANNYAAFGDWPMKSANCTSQSWRGIIREYCGVSIRTCDDDTYQEIIDGEEAEEMEAFPKEGCIRMVNDVLVVKVSDMH